MKKKDWVILILTLLAIVLVVSLCPAQKPCRLKALPKHYDTVWVNDTAKNLYDINGNQIFQVRKRRALTDTFYDMQGNYHVEIIYIDERKRKK